MVLQNNIIDKIISSCTFKQYSIMFSSIKKIAYTQVTKCTNHAKVEINVCLVSQVPFY